MMNIKQTTRRLVITAFTLSIITLIFSFLTPLTLPVRGTGLFSGLLLNASENYRLTALNLNGGGGAGSSATHQLFDAIGDGVNSGESNSSNFRISSGVISPLYDDASPNFVTISQPSLSITTTEAFVGVSGTTAGNASLVLNVGANSYSTTADGNGNFSAPMALTLGANVIQVESTDNFGQIAHNSVGIVRTIHLSSGRFRSRLHDASEEVTWTTISWQSDTPNNTTLVLRVRTGNTAEPDDGTWSDWSDALTTSGATINNAPGRYSQYEALFESSDGQLSSVLDGVTLNYSAMNTSTSIPLVAGWNMLSIAVQPDSSAITDVLASIEGNYTLVRSYNGCDSNDPWKTYDPSAPPFANDLTDINPSLALWINMSAADTLELAGEAQVNPTISLCYGWNLVAYPALQAQNVADALESINGAYILVRSYDASDQNDPWKTYDPSAPPFANDLTQMQPGRGYWIRVTEDVTWTME